MQAKKLAYLSLILCCIVVEGQQHIVSSVFAAGRSNAIADAKSIATHDALGFMDCIAQCTAEALCNSVNYGENKCMLFHNNYKDDSDIWKDADGYRYFMKKTVNGMKIVDPCDVGADETCDSLLAKYDIELIKIKKNWEDAKQGCIEKGKRLAVVDLRRKFDCLAEWLNEQKCEEDSWIGLKYNNDDEKSSQWINNAKLNENCEFWAKGEPNGKGEQCVLLLRGLEWKWNDHYCSRSYYFVCELEK